MEPAIPKRLQNQKKLLSAERPKTAIAYIRVSDKSQVEGESLDTQRETIERYAATHGIEIVRWFGDAGRSAKSVSKRADMMELLRYCARNKGKVGYALFYNMKRASRDAASYYADFKTVLQGLGIAVRSATEYIDDTPTGRFMETMLVANGQLDNEIKSQTTSDNMQSVARQGWWQHGYLLGYDLIRIKIELKKKHTTLKPNDDAPIVAELFNAFAAGGLTQADIKRMAKEKGLRNYKGKFLDDNGVNRMLTQPAYAGYICSKHTNFEMYEGKHFKDAIVDLDTFQQVQQRLNASSRNRTGIEIKVSNEQYPLKRFILCFNCSQPMYASSPKTGGGKSHSPRYHCARKSCRGKVPSIKAETANAMFGELLKDIQPLDTILKLYKEILNRTAMKQLDNLNRRLSTLRNGLSTLDEERATAMRKWNMGKMSDSDKDELILGIESDKAERREQIDALEKQQAVKQSQIDYAMNFMGNAHKLWIDADVDMRQRFQKAIFPEGVMLDTKNLHFGTAQISPLYRYKPNKKDLSESEKSLLVSHVDITWNSFLPYLVSLTDKLESLGFRYVDNEVMAPKEVTDEK